MSGVFESSFISVDISFLISRFIYNIMFPYVFTYLSYY